MALTPQGQYISAGDPRFYSICVDANFIYGASANFPPAIIKIDKTTLTEVARYNGVATDIDTSCLLLEGGFLYATLGANGAPPRVARIDPATMAEVAQWVDGVFDFQISAIGTDGTNLYVAVTNNPPQIIQVDIATLAEVGRWTGVVGVDDNVSGIAVGGGIVYASSNDRVTGEGRITSIDPATMTTAPAGVWLAAANQVTATSLFYYAGALYVGMMNGLTTQPVIARVNPATMTTILDFDDASITPAVAIICNGPNYLYSVYFGAGWVREIDRIALTIHAEQALALPGFLGLTTDGVNLYVNIDNTPAEVDVLGPITTVPPSLATDPASSIASSGAILNGTLASDGGEACTAGFEWGPTPALGNIVNLPGPYVTGDPIAAAISGLANDTPYYFRVFAVNSAGTTYGAITAFSSAIFAQAATLDATEVNPTSARVNGEITPPTYPNRVYVGFEWGPTPAFGIVTAWQVTPSQFNVALTGLTPELPYYFRTRVMDRFGNITFGITRAFFTTAVITETVAGYTFWSDLGFLGILQEEM